jgi:glycerate dehydrogenase
VQHKTVGIIGAGRIGTAYARMMAEGHKMNIVYYDPYPNKFLEAYVRSYGDLLRSVNEPAITCTRLETVEEVLKAADVRTSASLMRLGFLFGSDVITLITAWSWA